jgi:uncharacterized protein
MRCMRWLVAAAILAIVGSTSVPVQAQFFWDQQQYQSKRSRPQSDGFFGNWFNPFNSRPRERDYYSRQRDDDSAPPAHRQYQHTQQPTESSRAPPPRKAEAKGEQTAPTTSIVVMGDDMADWLAYGLEDVFSDSPEVRILRKNKLGSGLVRYDSKGDLDWWHVARDTLAQEKSNYIVMMLGLSDRGEIREKDIAKEAETRAKEQQAKDQAKDQAKEQSKDEAEKKGNQKSAKTDDTAETGTPAGRPRKPGGSAEFRSDEWEKIYSRRIDDTIAALKSKGVPVIWVGLPPIRGARSSGDVAYLNEFYRSRAERAGITYIDVWDGFVDEAGKYSNYGPDYEGQVRRLRLGDGVFFTKAGAIKLARYVEHELSRYMSNRVPVALPSGPVEPSPSEAKPAERPLMGPVVPLTGKGTETPKDSDELLGAPGGSSIHGDALAMKVLAKGETMAAPTGRADNFGWRLTGAANAAQSAPVAPVAAEPNADAKAEPKGTPTGGASALASAPADQKQEEHKKGAGKSTQRATKRAKQEEASASSSGSSPTSSSASTSMPKPPRDGIPRPPRPIDASNGSSNGSWNGSWFGSSNGSRGLFNWSR